jgi:hypothetical protein
MKYLVVVLAIAIGVAGIVAGASMTRRGPSS